MSDINYTVDISSFVKATADILDLTAKQKRALKDLIVTTANLDKEGKARVAYTESQINANQRLVATLVKNGKQWETEALAIKSTTQALQRQREELQRVLSVDIRKAVGSVSKARGVVFSTEELARIEKIKTTIGKLDTEVVKPELVKEFFASIKAGNIPEATGALARLRDELVKLNRVQEQARARQAREGALGAGGVSEGELRRRAEARAKYFQSSFTPIFTTDLAKKFGVDLDKISLQNENQIRAIGARIAGIMRRSISEDPDRVVSNDTLRKLLPDLLKGNKLDFINKPELQAAATQVGQLIGLFERLKRAQDAANTVSPAAANRATKAATSKIQEAAALSFLGSGFNTTVQKTLESQFKINPSDLTRKQEEAIKQAFANIGKAIRRSASGLDLTQVNDIFNNLLKGTAGIPATAELQRVYEQLNRVIGLYERLRQVKDRKARQDQDAVDQTLLSGSAARRIERQTQVTQERLRRAFSPLNAALGGVDGSLSLDTNNKINGYIRKIGELGTKAGLTSRQVVDLFGKFNEGTLSPAEQKYQRILSLFAKINAETTRLRQSAADRLPPGGTVPPIIGTGAGGGPVVPRVPVTAKLPPDDGALGRAHEFSGIWEKLRNSFDYFLIYRGVNILTDQLSQAATRARQLQVQISLIRTISQDAQQTFGQWQTDLVRISNETGLDITDVANAAYDTVSNQVARGRQVTDFLRVAGDLARTTNSSLQDSVNLLSSSINAFGRDVGEAEQSAARFFRAIDLGRFKAQDIANVFGRVAFVGRDLGVKEEEILAVISTLTRSGITADDAITLMTNAMNKLTNPTEKMKNLLNEWGFGGSGRVATQTEGFTNILGRMIEAARTGKVELTELFNEIRGEKFASAFKNFGGQIGRDLSEIRDNAPRTYAEARVIRGESDADKVNKQLNELRNSLTATFGNEITNLLKQVLDLSGGVQNLVTALTLAARMAIVGGSAFATYKAAMLATGAAVGVYNGALGAMATIKALVIAATTRNTVAKAAETTATAASTIATAENAAAMRASAAAYAVHPIGLLVAGAAAVYAYWQTSTYNIGLQTEAVRELQAEYEKLQRTQREQRTTSVFENIGAENEKVQEGLRRVSRELSQALSTANSELDQARTKASDTSNALREGFDRYSQFAKDRISEIAREFNRLDDRINSSNKRMLSIREAARQVYFQAGVQYSGGFEYDQFTQREQLLRNERENIRKQIAAHFAKGDDESVQAAHQLGQALIRLDKEIFDLRVERSKLQAEAYNRANGIHGRTFLQVDRGELSAMTGEDVRFFEAQEKAYQTSTRKKAGQQQATEVAMRARLTSAQRAVNEINSLQIFGASGGVNPDFANKTTGQLDMAKVKAKIENIRQRIKKGLDPEALRQAGPEIDRLIDERFSALQSEISATQAVENLRQRQNQVVEGINKMQQAMVGARQTIQQYAGDIQNLAGKLSTAAQALNDGAPGLQGQLVNEAIRRRAAQTLGNQTIGRGLLQFGEKGNELARDLLAQFGKETPGGQNNEAARARISAVQVATEEAKNLLNDLPNRTVRRDGIDVLDQAAVDRAIGALQKAIALGKQLAADASSTPEQRADLERRLGVVQSQAVLNQVQAELLIASGKYNSAVAQLELFRQQSAAIGGGVNDAVTALQAIPRHGAGAVVTMTQIAEQAEKAAKATGDITRLLDRLAVPGGAAPPARPPQARMTGGDIYGYASGGGMGSDDQMVYAQAGEFIWNRTATRRFYPQISSGNNIGRTPVEFHVNAGDTINVGGVSINEAKDGQVTHAQLQRVLRRGERRG